MQPQGAEPWASAPWGQHDIPPPTIPDRNAVPSEGAGERGQGAKNQQPACAAEFSIHLLTLNSGKMMEGRMISKPLC